MIQRTLILIAFVFLSVPGLGQSSAVSSDSITFADSLLDVNTQVVDDLPGELPLISTPIRRSTSPKGWFFLLNCGLLMLLVLKFTVFQGYSRKSWNAWINENLFFQLIREKAPVNIAIVIIENILKIYVVSIIVLLIIELIVPGYHFTPIDLAKISVLALIFYVTKNLLMLLLAVVTDQLELYKVMNLNAIIFSSNAIYFLIPLILVVVYLAFPLHIYGVYLILVVFSAAVILLVIRALRIFLKAKIPLNLHFFLYLCAFEILPYLFLVKVLQTNVVH